MDKDERLKMLEKWWTLTESAHRPFLTQAKEDLDFYIGGERQWDAKSLQTLKAQNRPALTYNMLFSLVNIVSGYQRQNRQDIMVYNRKGGTKQIADILSQLIKHIHDGCFGDWETSMAFVLGIITGKGWLGLNVDHDDEVVSGDIKIENISPFRVYPDPFFERYDMSDAQFVFKIAWLPKARMDMAFPEKKEEFEGMVVNENDREPLAYTQGDKYTDQEPQKAGTDEIDKYRYRVKECWWKEFKEQKFLVGVESGVVRQVDFPKDKIKAILQQYPTLRLVKRVRPLLNLTTYVGNVEIQNIEDPLTGVSGFPIVPFFSYWLENNHWGVVTQLKDPQREVNKRVSQMLHHLNQSANSGWIADDNALADFTILEDFGSKPGIVIKKKPGSHLERLEPTTISDGHMKLVEVGKASIREISGVNPDLAGLPEDKNVSGYLMELRRNQGLISVESIYDNFRLTRMILGTRLVDMIQKTDVYTKDEILNIVVDGEAKEIPVNLMEKSGAVDSLKNDLSIGKYKVTVAESKTSPTHRLRDFNMLVEALKAGLPIPPDIILKASDIPYKDEILNAMGGQPSAGGVPAGGGVSPGGAPAGGQ